MENEESVLRQSIAATSPERIVDSATAVRHDNAMDTAASTVEISLPALNHNIETIRRVTGPGTLIAPVVKANAYGHGLTLCARAFADGGADWLCVNEVAEARAISALGLDLPIYLLGPSQVKEAPAIATLGIHVVSGRREHTVALAVAGRALGRSVPIHIKVETGTHRQGYAPDAAHQICRELLSGRHSGAYLAGVTTHLADVEDETEHTFARVQLDRFEAVVAPLPYHVLKHCASSAAQLLFPAARYDMVRPGIAAYGLWPSRETRIAAEIVHGDVLLRPALTWKTQLVAIHDAPRGEYVGYGRTHRLSRDSRIGLLPVGYYDGYDRQLSNRAHVGVNGQRAPVVGRVCMNMTMIDLSDVGECSIGDPAILLGGGIIDAEELAGHAQTINYEIVSRIHERIQRVPIDA
ncbi:MAG: alanine racemase [Myxococcota bacterium]